MGRPWSDIGTLQYRNVIFTTQENKAVSVITHFQEAIESQLKTTQSRLQDSTSCPTTILTKYVTRTSHLWSALPSNHTYVFDVFGS
ncbi:hypothetical protein BD408DRAFT_455546 [Parasitella parasitica]|nr:hypothetical protein BD408DRAFT_455546 [Parasitella parasitica]